MHSPSSGIEYALKIDRSLVLPRRGASRGRGFVGRVSARRYGANGANPIECPTGLRESGEKGFGEQGSSAFIRGIRSKRSSEHVIAAVVLERQRSGRFAFIEPSVASRPTP